ncbi:MAG: hypothetical protein R3258_02865 [Acidimicrobiia bacterium]|nr:hypothetical protein [Acidimicrobiia bacterium]
MTDVLDRADFFRSGLAGRRGNAVKEWHHFVVHSPDIRLLVNFSLSHGEAPTGRQLGRVIVLVHHRDWDGWIEEVSVEDLEVSSRGVSGRFGASRLQFDDGGYLVELNLPARGLNGRLRFVPVSKPFLKNNQPLGGGRMSWLFVPRLAVDGWVKTPSARFWMREAAAYHDHNWGPFRWGDDFGWQWGSALPHHTDEPWSLVFMRMTDRSHSVAQSQCLYVWHGGEPAAMFRDNAVTVTSEGSLGTAPVLTMPGIMSLLTPGTSSDVPKRIRLDARRGQDRVAVTIEPVEYARIAVPAEVGPQKVVALHEVSAAVSAHGVIGGEQMELKGSGVFEFLR